MTTTPSTTRAFLSLLLAGLLLCACLLPACAVDLRDLPDWVRAQLFPVELDYQGMYPIPGLAPTLTPVAPAAAATAGTPTTVSIPGAGDVGALRTIGGSPAGVRPDGLATVGGPGAAAAVGGLSTVGGPTVTAGGLGHLGTVSVPGGRPGDLTALGGVSVSGAAPRTGDLEAYSTEGLGEAGKCLEVLRTERLDESEFVAWAREHSISVSGLSQAYRLLTRESPYWNEDARVVCAALSEAAGPNLEQLDGIPVEGRPGLAIHRGLQDRPEDVQAVLKSISESDLDRIAPNAHYHVASTLLDRNKCLDTAMWAWMREASRLGPSDRALVCMELQMACERMHDGTQAIRDTLIPWAEDALSRPGSEGQWHRALPALLWAYVSIGSPERAVDRGAFWLQQTEPRGVPVTTLAGAKLELASALAATGEAGRAADILRDLTTSCNQWTAETAQISLIKLAQHHADVGRVEVLPPRLQVVYPSGIAVRIAPDGNVTRYITAYGNPTLRLMGTTCTVDCAIVQVIATDLDERSRKTRHQLLLKVASPPAGRRHEGIVVLKTNDPLHPTVDIPLTVDVAAGLIASPDALFFGSVAVGGECKANIVLSAHERTDFALTARPADDARVHVGAPYRNGASWAVPVSVDTSRPGVVDSCVTVASDTPGDPGISVHVYAHVVDR